MLHHILVTAAWAAGLGVVLGLIVWGLLVLAFRKGE